MCLKILQNLMIDPTSTPSHWSGPPSRESVPKGSNLSSADHSLSEFPLHSPHVKPQIIPQEIHW